MPARSASRRATSPSPPPSSLATPLAALLGHRYGPRALWLVALGGLPLLPPLASHSIVALTSAPDVYVVALAVCALASDERPLVAQAPPRMSLALFAAVLVRSEEHTSELQSRFGISYAVFC